MTRRGEITKLYHQGGEDNEVLNTKKGFASMLSAKLHRQHEVEHTVISGGWQYNTSEVGKEGEINLAFLSIPMYLLTGDRRKLKIGVYQS